MAGTGDFDVIRVRDEEDGGADVVTPLVGDPEAGGRPADARRAQRQAAQVLRLNGEDGWRRVFSGRIVLGVVVLINLPQIVAGAAVLGAFWDDERACDEVRRNRWRWWAVLATLRMFVFLVIAAAQHLLAEEPDSFLRGVLLQGGQRRLDRAVEQLAKLRNLVDVAGLVWFVIGNLWVFDFEGVDSGACSAERIPPTPLYVLCVAFIEQFVAKMHRYQ